MFFSPGSLFRLLENVTAVVAQPAFLCGFPVTGVSLCGEPGVEEPAEATAVPECSEGSSVDGRRSFCGWQRVLPLDGAKCLWGARENAGVGFPKFERHAYSGGGFFC